MLRKAHGSRDEETGTKDDDRKFKPARRSGWSMWNYASRWRRRRMVLVVLALLTMYFLFVDSEDHTVQPEYAAWSPGKTQEEPTGPPPPSEPSNADDEIMSPRIYDGPVNFYRLASSLGAVAGRTDGYSPVNRNVLFAMSSLQSVSALLPMICDMSTFTRTNVHAVLISRNDIPLADILAINGIDRNKCYAIWHDARPDYAAYSSDERAEVSVMGALSHIQDRIHPQAIITYDAAIEDEFFTRGLRNRTNVLDISVIEIPQHGIEDFTWLTRLDATSLRNWHVPTVDISIQIPSDSSSVLELLKTIKSANYQGLKPPRITLDLPASMDEMVKYRLERFKWPPQSNGKDAISRDGLIIRRRVASSSVTQEESATRFLETFYPADPTHSHVLVLSPEAQLSPQYFHYIMYTLLEYRYSTYGLLDNFNLLGISLETPTLLLDGKTTFKYPRVCDLHTDRFKELQPSSAYVPYLWQAPSSGAALFFGDKWTELHSFLHDRITKRQSPDNEKITSKPGVVSEALPIWVEFVVEYMRTRAYTMLYPASNLETLVTLHNNRYQQTSETQDMVFPDPRMEPFVRADHSARPPSVPEAPRLSRTMPLHRFLALNAELISYAHLPQLLHNGRFVSPVNVSEMAVTYANNFREEVGGCKVPKGKTRQVYVGKADDLFCWGDEDENDWELIYTGEERESGSVTDAANVARTSTNTHSMPATLATTPGTPRSTSLHRQF